MRFIIRPCVLVDSLHIHIHIYPPPHMTHMTLPTACTSIHTSHITQCTQKRMRCPLPPPPKVPVGVPCACLPKAATLHFGARTRIFSFAPISRRKALPQHCCFRMFQNVLEQKITAACLEREAAWMQREDATRGGMDSLASKTRTAC